MPRVRIPHRRRRAGVQVVHAVCVGDEPLRRGRELHVVVLRVLIPAHELDFVLAHVLREREELLEIQVLQTALGLTGVPAERSADRAHARRIGLPRRVAVVGTEERLRRQVVMELDRAGDIPQQAIFRRVIVELLDHRDRVAHVLRAGADLEERSVGVLNRLRGIEDHHVGEQSAGEAAAVFIRRERVVHARRAQVQGEAEPAVQGIVRRVQSALIPLEPTVLDDAFLVEVVHRRTILRLRGPAAEGEVVIHRETRARQRLLPIRGRVAERRDRTLATQRVLELRDERAVLIRRCEAERLGG